MNQDPQHNLERLKAYLANHSTKEAIDLIHQHPDLLDTKDKANTSGFFTIAYSGNVDVFKAVKQVKTQFNFYEAILVGSLELVKEHLDAAPELINAYAPDGFTPIALATFFGQTAIARFLLSNGADPGLCANNPARVNALHSAVARQNIDLCADYCTTGMDVNKPQSQQITALHAAAHHGNLEIVKLLIKYGADPTLKTASGDDAMSFARQDNRTEVVAYLNQLNQ